MNWRDLKEGDRIRLVEMPGDPLPVPPGTEGTVLFVQDLKTVRDGKQMHQIGVKWDNGRNLSLVEIDKWEKING
jgi:Domain of unknown function (DUF4314)